MIYGWAWKKGFVFFSLLSHRVHTALSWFHPPQNLHLPPRPVTQHIQLKIICVYVTSLPLCYLTTDQILEKRNKAFIVLSDSFQSARRNLTGLVLKVLFLSIVSLWKKKILKENMSFAFRLWICWAWGISSSLLVESSTVLAQLFTPGLSLLLLPALFSHISAPIFATTISAPALPNELRSSSMLWIQAYL